MAVGAFMRRFAADTGLSVVWAESLDDKLISLSVDQVQPRDVLLVLSRRLGCDLAEYGSLFYLGDPEKTDRTVFVGRIYRAESDEIQSLLNAIKTEQGTITYFDDGSLILVDKIEAVLKLRGLLDSLKEIDSPLWVVQFYISQENVQDSREIGVDVTDDISIAASLANGDFTSLLRMDITATFQAEISRSEVELVAQPLMFLRDGKTSSIQKVESIPVPQYTTTETGSVTISGYDIMDVGFQLNVGVRDWGGGKCALEYNLQMGDVIGYVNDSVPIEAKDSLQGETVVESGGVYLLGAFQRHIRESQNSGKLFATSHSAGDRTAILRVWAKVIRI
ncbi:MAG: hypothetical protein Q7Q73_02240 [Verrucomicrobiota bacterium JB024]|nr:hypothetical protein [Verrucomicrobiota bacterium JB024]